MTTPGTKPHGDDKHVNYINVPDGEIIIEFMNAENINGY